MSVHAARLPRVAAALPAPGPLPEMLFLPPADIGVDHTYQREPDSAHAQRILFNFNWAFFQAVTVTRDEHGAYWAIDGQHRILAARNHPGIKKIPCVVVEALSAEEQARGFLAVNGMRKHITPVELYWAALAARDPLYLSISEMLERVGLQVMTSTGRPPANKTHAIGTIKSEYKRHGSEPTERVLRILKQAWPDQPEVFTAAAIKAVAAACRDRPEFSEDMVARAMAKWTPRELVSKAALRAPQLGLKVFEAMWAMIVERIEALERG